MAKCKAHDKLVTKIDKLKLYLFIAIAIGLIDIVLPEGMISQTTAMLLCISCVALIAGDAVRKEGATAH